MKRSLTTLAALVLLLGSAPLLRAQAVVVDPPAPSLGQAFSITYDAALGTLPEAAENVWLHWGVVDSEGNWNPAPSSIWPEGSQPAGDGAAVQSPMNPQAPGMWGISIDPTDDIQQIQFVLTDLEGNWDNNGGANYVIEFVSGQTVAWWTPADPEPGDTVTVHYNAAAGTIPTPASSVNLHWGVNGEGGQWEQPPQSLWPEGTTLWSDGLAVQTPMVDQGDDLWELALPTDASIYRLAFVFTDGTNWDNNEGSDWEIYLADPPPPVGTWHRFVFDTRNAFAGYTADQVGSVHVAGSFNGWNATSWPLSEDPQRPGVWLREGVVGTGEHEYKFIVNGTHYILDPDNPATSDGQFTNSVLELEPRPGPYVVATDPRDHAVLGNAGPQPFQFHVHLGDTTDSPLASWQVRLDGAVLEGISWDAETGLVSGSFSLDGLATGGHELELTVTDSSGASARHAVWFGVHDGAGFLGVDSRGDDVGSGYYLYPDGIPGQADLVSVELDEAAGGDTIAAEVRLGDITAASRVLLQLSPDITALPEEDQQGFATELRAPPAGAAGLRLVLADTTSPDYDPAWHNRLLPGGGGAGIPVTVEVEQGVESTDAFHLRLAVADLEQLLGPYDRPWYLSLAAFLEGPEPTETRSFEPGAQHGALFHEYDPDVYDLMFCDDVALERRILANHTPNHLAAVDNVGRGFVPVAADQIGPNVGSDGFALTILTRGGTTVKQARTITGTTSAPEGSSVTLVQLTPAGTVTHTASVVEGVVQYADVPLEEGENRFQLEATVGDVTGTSPEMVTTRWVDPAPVVAAITGQVQEGSVSITVNAGDQQGGQVTGYAWSADPANPAPVTLSGDGTATVSFAAPTTPGSYFFDVEMVDGEGVPSSARAMVTVDSSGTAAFLDPVLDTAPWVRDAVVYEIYPRSYDPSAQLAAVTADLDRIEALGVNAIWLMPINPGPSGHGYEITDYYGIEEDYGTPEDFAALVEAAHARGIRIILDLVINHTAISHPFFVDGQVHGEHSLTWDYYARNEDGTHQYYYDWYSLPNLNYDNPDVWREFIEVSKYWVREYDIDGFRCDVAWGVMERNGQFWRAWRRELKWIKPDLFLLAEAGANDGRYLIERFDATYDWDFHHGGAGSLTGIAEGQLDMDETHSMITQLAPMYNPEKFAFRFLENHDEARYITLNDNDRQAKMAGTLLLSTPGLPMIYAGQEVGEPTPRGLIDWSQDEGTGLEDLYRRLVEARRTLPALRGDEILRLANTADRFVYSYARTLEGEVPVLALLNFSAQEQNATVQLDLEAMGLVEGEEYVVSDLLNRTHWTATGAELATMEVVLAPYAHRLLALGGEEVVLGTGEGPEQPLRFELEQNVPNPFNPSTRIAFTVPQAGPVVLRVYNLLGQRVATLVDAPLRAGRHSVHFRADGVSSSLASGVYIVRLEAGSRSAVRKMLLVK